MDFTKFVYYKKLFSSYADVVDLVTFRKMLGGISEKAALRLVQENHVKHFYIRQQYLMPKLYVIEYVMSQHYEEYRKCLKVSV